VTISSSKITHEISRHFYFVFTRWEDNIRMDLREIGWGGMDWIGLAQDRGKWRALVNTAMNLWVP
jgi:hypothetical protein